ncbi:MAG: TauD/TfdA family dioxygenase [Novosphingobium sp.]
MASVVSDKFVVRDAESAIGSIIETDKKTLLSGRHGQEIRELLEQRGVIVFPKVDFTDEEQVEVSKTIGKFVPEATGEIFKVTMDKKINPNAEYVKGAFYWHIDGTMNKVPIFASFMSAKVLSETGGNTGFSNTYAAYDALSEEEKNRIAELRVVHSFYNAQLYVEPEPSLRLLNGWMSLGTNELPLVWTHRSGRKSLVLGATAQYIVGMDPMESMRLLVRLRDWSTQQRFTYSHKWSVGDAVIWDNTGTMHRAEAYPLDSDRRMHRTKLEGDEPFA